MQVHVEKVQLISSAVHRWAEEYAVDRVGVNALRNAIKALFNYQTLLVDCAEDDNTVTRVLESFDATLRLQEIIMGPCLNTSLTEEDPLVVAAFDQPQSIERSVSGEFEAAVGLIISEAVTILRLTFTCSYRKRRFPTSRGVIEASSSLLQTIYTGP